jgi:hypothetical protein
VNLTKSGASNPVPCFGFTVGLTPILKQDNTLKCDSKLSKYVFNFTTNKYLRAYMHGYIYNAKNNSDTPVIAGGICTSLD